MAEIYDLIMGGAPDARMSAEAMARKIRGQRAMGAMGALAGGGVPALGKMNAEDASEDNKNLLEATKARGMYGEEKRALQQTLAGTKAENALQKALIDANAKMYGADAGLEGRMFAATMAAQAAAERRGTASDTKMEADIQKLSKDLGFLSTMPDDLTHLEGLVGKDREGMGPVGGSMLNPDWMTSSEGNANRQAAQRVLNAILYMASGKTVTEQEMIRQRVARGIGLTSADSAFDLGAPAVNREARDMYSQLLAKYRPEVIDEYRRRGGLGKLDAWHKGAAPGGASTQGGPVTVKSKAERDALPPGTTYLRQGDPTPYTKR